MRLHQGRRRDPGFDEFVRDEEAQCLIQAARRQADMGEMNMGEGLVAFGPVLAGAPVLGENASLHRLLIGCREQCHGARLVARREAGAAALVLRHPGKHRSGAERHPFAGNFQARTEAARPRVPFSQ
ncbi:MAG: hypothetical protein ACREDM_02310 [Methylocella sp.]